MTKQKPLPLLTIGHSNHPVEKFIGLLQQAGVKTVADVRTVPRSRRYPQFNEKALGKSLGDAGIDYLYFGRELGGRPADKNLLTDGVADYEKMAASEGFKGALDRLLGHAAKTSTAAMCAEGNPLECHRCLLVARRVAERGVAVAHILPDGAVIEHSEIEEKLLKLSGQGAGDLFAARDERLAAAYRARSRKLSGAE